MQFVIPDIKYGQIWEHASHTNGSKNQFPEKGDLACASGVLSIKQPSLDSVIAKLGQ